MVQPDLDGSYSSIDNDALSKMEDLRKAHRARVNHKSSAFAQPPKQPAAPEKVQKP